MRIFRPTNYDPNVCDYIIQVEPEPKTKENQKLMYIWCNNDYKYAHYWSNNWRKIHGYPLKRKKVNPKPVIYLKPEISEY